jgi:hypothetical protein
MAPPFFCIKVFSASPNKDGYVVGLVVLLVCCRNV